MSRYSLDSLDNDLSSTDNKLSVGLMKDSVTSMHENLRESGEHREVNDLLFSQRTSDDNTDKDAGRNEWSGVEVANQTKEPEKCCGNALIASTVDAVEKSRLTVEKLPAKHVVATLDFWAGRSVAKKFDVARRSSSSSSAEFRLRVSPPASRSGPDDIEGFMKAGKKLGKARRAIVDKGKKKQVSYLELHRRKFGVESRRCILTPEGSTPSICGDRIDERLGYVDERASATVSRDDESELDFYLRLMELGSRVPRETRSCEALDRSEPDEGVSKSSCDVTECFSDVVQPVERRNRVFYKPYSIEDYKCLSVPQADRSLGPDRSEMESKGEWLMRRRSYGDSVSARNRQRILHRAQKLKESRRADVQKLRLPSLTDVENPDPASKVDGKQEGNEIIRQARSSNRPKILRKKQADTRAAEIGEFPLLVLRGKTALTKSKHGSKVMASFTDLCETCSDTTEDLIQLRDLRLRHLEEKKRMDQLFKRTLCA